MAAKLLRVPVGNFSLKPRFTDTGFVMGSVSIAKTDIFRRFLVGVAPLIFGSILLVCVVYCFLFIPVSALAYFLLAYLFVTILNTMWLSKADLQGALWPVLILGIALIMFFVIHLKYE